MKSLRRSPVRTARLGEYLARREVTAGPGPEGKLPLSDTILRERPSGDAFGMSQDAGMGWDPAEVGGRQHVCSANRPASPATFLDALGYHTGHWEVSLAVKAPRRRPSPRPRHRRHCNDPCGNAAEHAWNLHGSLALSQRRGVDLPPHSPNRPQRPRRARRGHLRQGLAGDDDGVGRPAAAAVRARARR